MTFLVSCELLKAIPPLYSKIQTPVMHALLHNRPDVPKICCFAPSSRHFHEVHLECIRFNPNSPVMVAIRSTSDFGQQSDTVIACPV